MASALTLAYASSFLRVRTIAYAGDFPGTGIGLATIKRILVGTAPTNLARGCDRRRRNDVLHVTFTMTKLRPILLVEDNPEDAELTRLAFEQIMCESAHLKTRWR